MLELLMMEPPALMTRAACLMPNMTLPTSNFMP